MGFFDLVHVRFHAKSWSGGHRYVTADDSKRLLCQSLPILPDPMSVDRLYPTWRRCGNMREHRERYIEMTIRMRAPCQSPVITQLRDSHRALHCPEMWIGQRNIDGLNLNRMLQLTPVGRDHIGCHIYA